VGRAGGSPCPKIFTAAEAVAAAYRLLLSPEIIPFSADAGQPPPGPGPVPNNSTEPGMGVVVMTKEASR